MKIGHPLSSPQPLTAFPIAKSDFKSKFGSINRKFYQGCRIPAVLERLDQPNGFRRPRIAHTPLANL
jgi:hypothetical protein